MVSAASGNMLSSLIFVPKEIVKQKRQAAVALGEDSSSAIKVVVGMLQSNVSAQEAKPRSPVPNHPDLTLPRLPTVVTGLGRALCGLFCHSPTEYSQRRAEIYDVRGVEGQVPL